MLCLLAFVSQFIIFFFLLVPLFLPFYSPGLTLSLAGRSEREAYYRRMVGAWRRASACNANNNDVEDEICNIPTYTRVRAAVCVCVCVENEKKNEDDDDNNSVYNNGYQMKLKLSLRTRACRRL